MARTRKLKDRFLVAYPSAFPGVAIPLISDEECRARGIEPGRFPPRETWTQQQRDAADRLMDILLPYVFREALQVILGELEREPADATISEVEVEQAAARRGIALIDAGKWKQRDTTFHFPNSWIRQVLEMFAVGKLSILEPPPKERMRKLRGSKRKSR